MAQNLPLANAKESKEEEEYELYILNIV